MEGQKQKSWIVSFLSTMLIFAMFAISALILINVGMQVYKNVVLANNENFKLRTSLAYIATKVRQNDVEGMVSVREENGVRMLVLSEEIGGERYNTCIYYYNGFLCELIQKEGFEVNFDFGFQTVEVDDFQVEELDNGGIRLVAQNNAGDKEELLLYPRARR